MYLHITSGQLTLKRKKYIDIYFYFQFNAAEKLTERINIKSQTMQVPYNCLIFALLMQLSKFLFKSENKVSSTQIVIECNCFQENCRPACFQQHKTKLNNLIKCWKRLM